MGPINGAPVGGGSLEKRKKILNRGNELKHLLELEGLVVLDAKNEVDFECKTTQPNRKNRFQSPCFGHQAWMAQFAHEIALLITFFYE
jgi:hypothetical protein